MLIPKAEKSQKYFAKKKNIVLNSKNQHNAEIFKAEANVSSLNTFSANFETLLIHIFTN